MIRLAALLGRQCVGCGWLLVNGEGAKECICHSCKEALPWIRDRRCTVCSMPLVSEQGCCVRCRERSFGFDEHCAAFLYADLPEVLLKAYKFGQHIRLSSLFGEAVEAVAPPHYRHCRYVVPIPGNRKRTRLRGWSPTERLAREVGRNWAVPLRRMLRREAGGDQKELSYSGRMNSAVRRYSLRSHTAEIEAQTLVLVDDVFTTGATASACAELLKRAGAKRVFVVTIAID